MNSRRKGGSWCLAVASAGAVAALFVLQLSRPHISGHSSIARSNNPLSVLTEADRLSWRANWDAAGPLYERAEVLFRAAGDKRNEIHARVGRIRARSWSTSWEDVSQTLRDQLNDPVVKADPHLRLWCLAAKGYTDLDLDSASSQRAWTEALQIANSLGEDQWAARASGSQNVSPASTGTSHLLPAKLVHKLNTAATAQGLLRSTCLTDGCTDNEEISQGSEDNFHVHLTVLNSHLLTSVIVRPGC